MFTDTQTDRLDWYTFGSGELKMWVPGGAIVNEMEVCVCVIFLKKNVPIGIFDKKITKFTFQFIKTMFLKRKPMYVL